MTKPRPETRPPIRQANDLLAEAHRLATLAGDKQLISDIDAAWNRAAQLSERAEQAEVRIEQAA